MRSRLRLVCIWVSPGFTWQGSRIPPSRKECFVLRGVDTAATANYSVARWAQVAGGLGAGFWSVDCLT